MQDKDNKLGSAVDGLTPEEEHKITVRVDKMLDVSQPDIMPVAKPKTLPPLDIFTDPRTAPEVPPEVLKTMKVGDLADKDPAAAAEAGSTPLDDEKVSKAVDDIAANESDEVLAAEDEAAKQPEAPKKSIIEKLKAYYWSWWHNKKLRYSTLTGAAVILIVLGLVPQTRAFALNIVGVRATAKVTVLDNTTQLPLKGAKVQIGAVEASTDSNGNVTLKHVKLGKQKMTVQKIAFATVTRTPSIGLGTSSLGNIALTAVGTQYHFAVSDYVSSQPVTTASATSGESNAQADKKGAIVLTVTASTSSSLTVSVSADNYRTQNVTVPVGSTSATKVQLVPARAEVYITKQSGTYDLYKVDIDGQNKKLLLAGTGNENDQITLVSHPTDEEVALVDTRDNIHDSGGYLEQALTLVNVDTGSPQTLEHSDHIQIIDWVGDHLVYVLVKPGASAGNPSRYELISYNYKTNQRLQLDHANAFNDIVSANGTIYYASSNNYSGGVSQFNKINPDGTSKTTLLTNEIWNIFRTGYSDFSLSSASGWYTYHLGDSKPATTTAAYSGTSRLYLDSNDGKNSLWVDNRDGKGALILYNKATGKETTLAEQSGLSYPVRWLNDTTIIYRVTSSQGTSDYAVSVQGGTAKKILDVTNTNGITLWYFY